MRRVPPFQVMEDGRGIRDATGEPVLWDGNEGGFSTDTHDETAELMRLFALAPELLAVARYAAEHSSSARDVAIEALAQLPGEEALLERLGYLVVDGKPSRDAYEEKLARENRR